MKTPYYILFFITVTLFISSCCKCMEDDYQVRLRIVSAQTGDDLIFGPASKYNSKEIKIFALNGADTVWLSVFPFTYETLQPDSALLLSFYARSLDVGYLILAPNDMDTLRLERDELKKGCCKGRSVIGSVYYNDVKLTTERGSLIARK